MTVTASDSGPGTGHHHDVAADCLQECGRRQKTVPAAPSCCAGAARHSAQSPVPGSTGHLRWLPASCTCGRAVACYP